MTAMKNPPSAGDRRAKDQVSISQPTPYQIAQNAPEIQTFRAHFIAKRFGIDERMATLLGELVFSIPEVTR